MEEKVFYKQNTLPALEEKEADPSLPEKIGPYKIEILLAKGGMSLLYLGLTPDTKEMRVIKVLSPAYLNHPEMVDHFLWEAKIISLTDHPNIIKVFDNGKWEQGLYIAMEFVRGISLKQFLMQKSFSLKRCLDIILQVAYALSHLHTHGVIHRDLKPENILIAEDGEVKVIDFGIAQLHEEKLPSSHKILGTPNYMSPEQKENSSHVSFASDLFSLGVIAYELIVGKLSYGILNLTLLPPGLQKIIGKAVAVSVSERYDDIIAFIHDLTSYYTSEELEREKPSTDQATEILEIFQKTDQLLSNFEKPKWPQFDMGIAQERAFDQLGIYFETVKLPNQTTLLLCAHMQASKPENLVYLAILRGMIKALLSSYQDLSKVFDPIAFVSLLNTLVCQDSLQKKFSLQLLKLIPQTDTLIYLSCGSLGSLFHFNSNTDSARTLHNQNPAIGQDPTSVFTSATDNFFERDMLIFHNFSGAFESILYQTLYQNTLLSPTRLAEMLLQSAKTVEPPSEHSTYPKLIVSLQRLA